MREAKPLTKQTADRIINYIMEEHLATGQKLPNEFELAQRLGVGRSTVREAVKALVTRNVLEVRQGAGTFVTGCRMGVAEDPLGFTFIKDKRKLIMDLLEVRMIIEPRIAAMAAASASGEDIAELARLQNEIEHLIGEGKDHIDADIALHAKLAESSGNLVVPNLLPIIQNAISLFINATNRQLRQETIETHRMIVNAVARHDPMAASDAMTLHIVHNRNNMRQMFAETPERFVNGE